MSSYNQQLTPPVGAFQQDINSLRSALDPVARSGGVTDSRGRGHTPLHPVQAQLIAQRGTDFSALISRPQTQVQGREL